MDEFAKAVGVSLNTTNAGSNGANLLEAVNNTDLSNSLKQVFVDIAAMEVEAQERELSRMNQQAAIYFNQFYQELSYAEKVRRQQILKARCEKDTGYIIWLNGTSELSDFSAIRARPIDPANNKNMLNASKEISSAARKLIAEIGFRVSVLSESANQEFQYTQNVLTIKEFDYLSGYKLKNSILIYFKLILLIPQNLLQTIVLH